MMKRCLQICGFIEAVQGTCVKVILETCLLDKEEIRREHAAYV